MKVLHISAGNLFGGVESLQVTLARHRGHCPEITPHFALCFDGRLASELRSAGVSVYSLGEVRVRRPWTVWRARRTLAALIRRHRFDVVVCHSVWSQAIFGPVVRSAALPLVFWLHNAPCGKHWLERWAKWTQPDRVICNSRFTFQALPSLYRGIPTTVLYCPVGTSPAAYTPTDRETVRAELGATGDTIVVIQVGRLESLKGHRSCLEALATLADLPRWVCWQVGGAQRMHEVRYLETLKSTAARLGITNRIRFVGQRADVPKLLSAADIYCQPNTGPDSFGITFVEALLAKLPVVTTALGGAVEIVDDSCGILVPPGDPTILAASLRRLILDSNLRSRLGAGGPSRARRLCDPPQQVSYLYEFFRRAWRRDPSDNLFVIGDRPNG
jgi:glycosyltransferase involved in cell wall biosynthesis